MLIRYEVNDKTLAGQILDKMSISIMAGSNLPNFSLFQRKAFACTFTSRHEVKKCLDVKTSSLEKKMIFQC